MLLDYNDRQTFERRLPGQRRTMLLVIFSFFFKIKIISNRQSKNKTPIFGECFTCSFMKLKGGSAYFGDFPT